MIELVLTFVAMSQASAELPLATAKANYFFKQEDGCEKTRFLDSLAKNKDHLTLRFIMKEAKGTYWAEVAAARICRCLDTKRAFEFCETLPPESSEWMVAMFELGDRPKHEVVGTYTKLLNNLRPQERAVLYSIFARRRWPEIANYAQIDSTSDVILPWRNTPLGEPSPTVGDLARGYLAVLQRTADPILNWHFGFGDLFP